MQIEALMFCEKVHRLADGRHSLSGVYSGRIPVRYVPNAVFDLDLFISLSGMAVGQRKIELTILGMDGTPLSRETLDGFVSGPDGSFCIVANNLKVPVREQGSVEVRVACRESGWSDSRSMPVAVTGIPPKMPVPITGTFGNLAISQPPNQPS